MESWFTASWSTIGFVSLSTSAIYISSLIGIRLAGRRTVSQISALDFVVTIALGSIIGATAVSRDPSYAQGLAAVVTLLLLQMALAGLRIAWPASRRLLDFSPQVVARDGQLHAMSSPLTAQMTAEDIASRLREKGFFEHDRIRVAILENDGKMSVQPTDPGR